MKLEVLLQEVLWKLQVLQWHLKSHLGPPQVRTNISRHGSFSFVWCKGKQQHPPPRFKHTSFAFFGFPDFPVFLFSAISGPRSFFWRIPRKISVPNAPFSAHNSFSLLISGRKRIFDPSFKRFTTSIFFLLS